MSIITDLHQAIKKTLRAEMKGIRTISSYPTLRNPVRVPAIFVDLASLEPGSDPGTEQLALIARMEARVVVSSNRPHPLKVRELAAEVARVIHQQTFGLEVTPAKILSINSDGFSPEMVAYDVWLVEWEHELHLGESVWDSEGVIPETVYIGFTPEIGTKYEEKYHLFSRK